MAVSMATAMTLSSMSTAFALNVDGKDISGAQIGDKFYSLEYITQQTDNFAEIVATAGSDIILDVNGVSANLGAFLTSGTDLDFDTWAADPANQTLPNPAVIVNGDGSETQIVEELSVESVSAVTSTEIKVIFNKDLVNETVKPSNFTIVEKDNEYNEPYIDAVKVAGNVVTMTLGDSLADATTYVVTVNGIAEGSVEVTYNKAIPASVVVTTDKLPSSGSAQLAAKVYDASGNDVTGDFTVSYETNQTTSVVATDGSIADVTYIDGNLIGKAYVTKEDGTKVYSTQFVLVAEDVKAVTYEGFTIDADGEVADYSALAADDIKTSIKLDETTMYLFPFVKDQFDGQYGTNVTSDGYFTFESKNPTVLVINETNGALTPVAEGTATIVISDTNSDFKKSIAVEVKAAAKATTIEVAETSISISDSAPNKAVKVTVKDQYGDAVVGATVAVAIDEEDGNDIVDATMSGETDADGEATLTIDPKAKGTETIVLSNGTGDDKIETSISVEVLEAGTVVTGYVIENSADDNVLDVADATDNQLTLTLYPVDADGNIAGDSVDADWTFKDADDTTIVNGDNNAGVVDWAETSKVVTVDANEKGTVTATAKVGTLEVATFDITVVDSTPQLGSVSLTKNTLALNESDSNALTAVLENIVGKDTEGNPYDKDNDGTADVLDDAEIAAIYSSNTGVISSDTNLDGSGDALTINAAGTTTLTITFEDVLNIDPISVKVNVADDVAPTTQDSVFASAQVVKGGATVTLNQAPADGNTAWFAPAGTTTFTEGATMTKLVGDGTATDITSPATEGTYKLFVVDTAGNISTASTATLTVDDTAPTAAINTESATAIAIDITDSSDVTTTLDSQTIQKEAVSINAQNASSVDFAITSASGGLVSGDTFTFTITDEAGNSNTYDATYDGTNWSIAVQ
jgi:hypothetical protein